MEVRKELIETIIKKNMARHFNRLSERLNEINTAKIIMETLSREFRFLEDDLIKECKEVRNDGKQQF